MIRESYFIDDPHREPVEIRTFVGLSTPESDATIGVLRAINNDPALCSPRIRKVGDKPFGLSGLVARLGDLANSDTKDWRSPKLLSHEDSLALSILIRQADRAGIKGATALRIPNYVLQEAGFALAGKCFSRAKVPWLYTVLPPRMPHRFAQHGAVLLGTEMTPSTQLAGAMLTIRTGIEPQQG